MHHVPVIRVLAPQEALLTHARSILRVVKVVLRAIQTGVHLLSGGGLLSATMIRQLLGISRFRILARAHAISDYRFKPGSGLLARNAALRQKFFAQLSDSPCWVPQAHVVLIQIEESSKAGCSEEPGHHYSLGVTFGLHGKFASSCLFPLFPFFSFFSFF